MREATLVADHRFEVNDLEVDMLKIEVFGQARIKTSQIVTHLFEKKLNLPKLTLEIVKSPRKRTHWSSLRGPQ